MDVRAVTGIYRFLKARRFDIVHTHSSKAGIVGRVAARWAGAPVIIHTPHGHVFYGYFGPIVTRLCLMLERWCARFTDRIITLTGRGRRKHLDLGVGLPEQYSVIPSGIPLENFFPDPGRGRRVRERLGIPPEAPVLGTVGRLTAIKDQRTLIVAAKILKDRHPDLLVLLIGDSGRKGKLEALTRDLGLEGRIRFLGWQPDVLELLNALNVLLLCSLNEGMGRALVEAMASGLPVVAHECGRHAGPGGRGRFRLFGSGRGAGRPGGGGLPHAERPRATAVHGGAVPGEIGGVYGGEDEQPVEPPVPGPGSGAGRVMQLGRRRVGGKERRGGNGRPRPAAFGWVAVPLLVFACLVLLPAEAEARKVQPFRALVGVRSNFSGDGESVEALSAKAQRLGISAILFADHHRLSLSWGLPPFRNLLRKKQEFPSVYTSGVSPYLKTVLGADEKHPRAVIIPGVTTTPFYYWTGSPFQGDLTARQWHTRMMVFGMNNRPEAFEDLPEIDGGYTLLYARRLLTGTAFFLGAALIGLILFFGFRRWRVLAFLVFMAGGLSAVNYHPFSTSPFDAYHGNQGALPYQFLIDFVNARGGVILWPGEGGRDEKAGAARLVSRPRPDLLESTRGYTAFDAFTAGRPAPTAPGGVWDKMLGDFTEGLRGRPPWIFGGVERSRGDGGGGAFSTKVQTVLYLEERSQAAVLDAFRGGRMYALREGNGVRLELSRFSVTPRGLAAIQAVPGHTLDSLGPVTVSFQITAGNLGPRRVTARIIRQGRTIKTFNGATPLEGSFADDFVALGKTCYYRLEVWGPSGARILTNPVFVKYPPAARSGPTP